MRPRTRRPVESGSGIVTAVLSLFSGADGLGLGVHDLIVHHTGSGPGGHNIFVELGERTDDGTVEIVSRPRTHHHGHHLVRWPQDGRMHTAEGSTLAAALRAAKPRSAQASDEGAT